MNALSAEQLAQRVIECNLLDERELESIWSELGTREATADEFYSIAVRRQLLTNFQVERMERGERTGYFYGDYKVLYLVGTGTFARVYRALHKEIGNIVAVKVLRRRYSEVPTQTEQFLREGRMGMSLRHPNIVAIHEVHSQGRYHFLVMEFVEGRNLREFVKVRKKIAPDEAVQLASQLASGLSYAFHRGVTHRDLKMSNVLVSSTGTAQLVDFGLAVATGKLAGDDFADCPNPRTIDYAALERITGAGKDDKKSDIFFLGCILYHMLTGEAPLHASKDKFHRMSRTRFQEIKRISTLEPDMPRRLAAVVNKAMHMSPSKRYQTPTEMLNDLVKVGKALAAGELDKEPRTDDTEIETDMTIVEEESPEQDLRTVMLIESNVAMQNVLRDRLKKRGHRVLVFSSPERAFDRFAEDETMPADCVILSSIDLGSRVIESFNQFARDRVTKGVPAVLLLGEHDGNLADQAELADHRVVVHMPIRFKEFREILDRLMGIDAQP